AEQRRVAQGNAVPFGRVCDSYRLHLKEHAGRLDKAESRILNLEAFFGRERDSAAIGWDEYQELLDEVALMSGADTPALRAHAARDPQQRRRASRHRDTRADEGAAPACPEERHAGHMVEGGAGRGPWPGDGSIRARTGGMECKGGRRESKPRPPVAVGRS